MKRINLRTGFLIIVMRKFLFIPLALVFLFLTQIVKADFYLGAIEMICDENNFSVESATLTDDVFEQVLRNNEFSVIKKGIYKQNTLGVIASNVTKKIAKKHNLIIGKGVFIHEVLENGAAYKAGLRNNDVILSISINNVDVDHDYDDELEELPLGYTVDLTVIRQDETSPQIINLNVVLDTKEVQLEGYGNELLDIFIRIQDNTNDLKKLKSILRTEKNLLINFHKEEAVCKLSQGTIKTTFNIIGSSGKGQCGAGDWGFTCSQTINGNTIFNDFHMNKMNCFGILQPSIKKIDVNFVNPKKINVILSGRWNNKENNNNLNLPLDENFINNNFLGCDNFMDYEPQCENEFEIKELEFNLN